MNIKFFDIYLTIFL